MILKLYQLFRRVTGIYLEKQIPRSAAALSYYLTMSLFPLVICLYSLLGSNYGKMMQILELADSFMNPETTQYIKSFLAYVATNHSTALLVSGLIMLLSTASAGVRVMQQCLREIQGETRWRTGLRSWLLSFLFSLAFVAALYFGILVMLTGQTFLELVEKTIPFLPISRSWTWMRFPVLGGLVFLTLWGTLAVADRKQRIRRSTAPGALTATAGIVLMSWIFSEVIAASSRYSLVYGSLASLILLMFWLFLCSQMIYLGAAVNQAIRETGT